MLVRGKEEVAAGPACDARDVGHVRRQRQRDRAAGREIEACECRNAGASEEEVRAIDRNRGDLTVAPSFGGKTRRPRCGDGQLFERSVWPNADDGLVETDPTGAIPADGEAQSPRAVLRSHLQPLILEVALRKNAAEVQVLVDSTEDEGQRAAVESDGIDIA